MMWLSIDTKLMSPGLRLSFPSFNRGIVFCIRLSSSNSKSDISSMGFNLSSNYSMHIFKNDPTFQTFKNKILENGCCGSLNNEPQVVYILIPGNYECCLMI